MRSTLAPWSVRPLQVFDQFRRELDDLFGQGNSGSLQDGNGWFVPRSNVAETDKQYEITLDVPGMATGDFQLEMQDGQLWVSGRRQQEKEESGKTFHRVERTYGEFRRSYALGGDVDADKVEANYKDGVLKVVVPKSEKARPRRIEVQS